MSVSLLMSGVGANQIILLHLSLKERTVLHPDTEALMLRSSCVQNDSCSK